jgi:hypothetical protein
MATLLEQVLAERHKPSLTLGAAAALPGAPRTNGLNTGGNLHPYIAEILRPWKLVTLALGILILVVGSYTEGAPDWDVGVSLIMAAVAYLTAPQAVRGLEHFVVQLFKHRAFAWKHLLASLFLVWFGADGCYYLYWSQVNPWALEMMREANFLASVCLYLLCGYLWKSRASLRGMLTFGRA